MKINHQIIMTLPQSLYKRTYLFQWLSESAATDIFAPGYARVRIKLAQCTKRWQSMNNIAYRAEFYNEYIHFLSFNSELHPTDNEAARMMPCRRIPHTLRKPTTQPTKLVKGCDLG